MLNHRTLLKRVKELKSEQAQFLSMACIRLGEGEFGITYTFAKQEQARELVRTATVDRSAPSLILYFSNSDFPERQAYEDLGIKFFGNPNLAAREEMAE